MSRQSKQAANARRAQQFVGGGPEKTTPKHGKRNRMRSPESPRFKQYSEQIANIAKRIREHKSFADLQGFA